MMLTKGVREQSMKYSTRDGLFSAMFAAMTSTFLSAFALALGADNIYIGLLSSIPLLFWTLAQMPSAKLVERIGSRKSITFTSITLSRLMWVLIILIPFMNLHGNLMFLLLFVTISSLLHGMSNPAWTSWMGDLVPQKIRGKYFGARMRASTFFSMLALLLCILIFQMYPKTTLEGFQIVFFLGVISGLCSSFYLRKVAEPDFMLEEKEAKERQKCISVRDKRPGNRLKKFLLIFFIWNFSVMLASPFFVVRLIETLHADYYWIAVQIIIDNFFMFAFQGLWGKYSDRFGNKLIMSVCAIGAAFYPFCWLFITDPIQIIPVEILSGIAWGGFNLTYFNYLICVSPPDKRPKYSAMFNVVLGTSGVIGPILGGVISEYYVGSYLFGFTQLEAVFFLSWILRLSAAVLFIVFLEEIEVFEKYRMAYVFGDIRRYGQTRMASFVTMTERAGAKAVVLTEKEVKHALGDIVSSISQIHMHGRTMHSMGMDSGHELSEAAKELEKHTMKVLDSTPKNLRVLENSAHEERAEGVKESLEKARRDMERIEKTAMELAGSSGEKKEHRIKELTKIVTETSEKMKDVHDQIKEIRQEQEKEVKQEVKDAVKEAKEAEKEAQAQKEAAERIRKEAEEADRKAHEERETADKARKEAEEKAKEAEKMAREEREASEKAAEKAADKAKKEADDAAKEVEKKAQAEREAVEKAAKEAEEKARREKDIAEKAAKEAEETAREAERKAREEKEAAEKARKEAEAAKETAKEAEKAAQEQKEAAKEIAKESGEKEETSK
jgi:MFS family permease/predicted heme/steroid binding protein